MDCFISSELYSEFTKYYRDMQTAFEDHTVSYLFDILSLFSQE